MSNKIILYIAVSEDGFIADKDGGVDWLPHPEEDSKDDFDEIGYKALLARIKYIFMGSRSYEQILGFGEWAWTDKITYVFTKNKSFPRKPNIHYADQSIADFMNDFVKVNDGNIWLLGGAELAKSFSNHNLIDEIVLTVIPVQLKKGIKLEVPLDNFTFYQTKQCCGNLKQHYYLKNDEKT